MATITPTELASKTGLSLPYASQIIGEKRIPQLALSLRIYDATGEQFGPLKGLKPDEIKTARKMANAA